MLASPRTAFAILFAVTVISFLIASSIYLFSPKGDSLKNIEFNLLQLSENQKSLHSELEESQKSLHSELKEAQKSLQSEFQEAQKSLQSEFKLSREIWGNEKASLQQEIKRQQEMISAQEKELKQAKETLSSLVKRVSLLPQERPREGKEPPPLLPISEIPAKFLPFLPPFSTSPRCDLLTGLDARKNHVAFRQEASCRSPEGKEVLRYFLLNSEDWKEDFLRVEGAVLDFSRHSIEQAKQFRGLPAYDKALLAGCHPDQRLTELQSQWKYDVIYHIESMGTKGIDYVERDPCQEPGVVEEEIPTVFLTREGTTGSQWHNMMEMIGLYLAVVDSGFTGGTKDFKVIIMDGHHVVQDGQGEGNLVPLIQHFTSYPVQDFRDYAGKKVCFKNGLFPTAGWRVYFWRNVWDPEPCPFPSLILLNFRHIALKGFGIDEDLPRPWGVDTVKVFWLIRKERRVLINEDEFRTYLQNFGYPGIKLEVTENSFQHSQTLQEQIEMIRGADVIISPHGAGLTNIMFGRPLTHVIELLDTEHEKNRYFANLAAFGMMFHVGHYSPQSVAQSPHVDLSTFDSTFVEILGKIIETRRQLWPF